MKLSKPAYAFINGSGFFPFLIGVVIFLLRLIGLLPSTDTSVP